MASSLAPTGSPRRLAAQEAQPASAGSLCTAAPSAIQSRTRCHFGKRALSSSTVFCEASKLANRSCDDDAIADCAYTPNETKMATMLVRRVADLKILIVFCPHGGVAIRTSRQNLCHECAVEMTP